ncbi:MAG: hypothetical protein MPW14_24710 (plasmid) [Candidatus Manganitrophus sp.]|nr:MAG: hypothetical protein MPW14_24710 [Candidatus Manganitrophus sp.]
MQLLEGFAMLHHSKPENTLSFHLFQRISFDHPKTSGVHIKKVADTVDKFNAFRLILNDGTQPLLSLLQRFFRPLALSDIRHKAFQEEEFTRRGENSLPLFPYPFLFL